MPTVTISLADDVFQQLADGKINGQKVRYTPFSPCTSTQYSD